VLVGGVGGLNGPELAEWLNRARLGLSSGEVARIAQTQAADKHLGSATQAAGA